MRQRDPEGLLSSSLPLLLSTSDPFSPSLRPASYASYSSLGWLLFHSYTALQKELISLSLLSPHMPSSLSPSLSVPVQNSGPSISLFWFGFHAGLEEGVLGQITVYHSCVHWFFFYSRSLKIRNDPDITGPKCKKVDFRDKFGLNPHSLCHLLGIYSWVSYLAPLSRPLPAG